MYLSDQKAVITRQWDGHCGQVDISGLAISDSLETTLYKARNLKSVDVLKPHQPLSSPLEVLQFGQLSLFLLVTGPEGWIAEGQKVNFCGGVGWVFSYHHQMCL